MRGRPPLPGDLPASVLKLGELATSENIVTSQVKPLIQGRHMIALGYEPGNWFGLILKNCYEAQLDGVFEDETSGVAWLVAHMQEHPVE